MFSRRQPQPPQVVVLKAGGRGRGRGRPPTGSTGTPGRVPGAARGNQNQTVNVNVHVSSKEDKQGKTGADAGAAPAGTAMGAMGHLAIFPFKSVGSLISAAFGVNGEALKALGIVGVKATAIAIIFKLLVFLVLGTGIGMLATFASQYTTFGEFKLAWEQFTHWAFGWDMSDQAYRATEKRKTEKRNQQNQSSLGCRWFLLIAAVIIVGLIWAFLGSGLFQGIWKMGIKGIAGVFAIVYALFFLFYLVGCDSPVMLFCIVVLLIWILCTFAFIYLRHHDTYFGQEAKLGSKTRSNLEKRRALPSSLKMALVDSKMVTTTIYIAQTIYLITIYYFLCLSPSTPLDLSTTGWSNFFGNTPVGTEYWILAFSAFLLFAPLLASSFPGVETEFIKRYVDTGIADPKNWEAEYARTMNELKSAKTPEEAIELTDRLDDQLKKLQQEVRDRYGDYADDNFLNKTQKAMQEALVRLRGTQRAEYANVLSVRTQRQAAEKRAQQARKLLENKEASWKREDNKLVLAGRQLTEKQATRRIGDKVKLEQELRHDLLVVEALKADEAGAEENFTSMMYDEWYGYLISVVGVFVSILGIFWALHRNGAYSNAAGEMLDSFGGEMISSMSEDIRFRVRHPTGLRGPQAHIEYYMHRAANYFFGSKDAYDYAGDVAVNLPLFGTLAWNYGHLFKGWINKQDFRSQAELAAIEQMPSWFTENSGNRRTPPHLEGPPI